MFPTMLAKPPTGLPPLKLSVFIAGTRRSGSSLLCAFMDQTGVLGRAGEYFDPDVKPEGIGNAELDLVGRSVLARIRGTTGNGVMASKIFWEHRQQLARLIDFDAWFPNQRWVFLRRRDLLGQAVSFEIAKQTRLWSSRHDAVRLPVYGRDKIAGKLKQLLEHNKEWERFFSARGIAPLKLTYEDIVDDMHGTIADIAAFVGGPALKDDVLASPPFTEDGFDWVLKKQRTGLNEEWRRRFLAE
jgi:LPS sulfotransferase NodH